MAAVRRYASGVAGMAGGAASSSGLAGMGGVGGGAAPVGSSVAGAYAPKEFNKETTPEKVSQRGRVWGGSGRNGAEHSGGGYGWCVIIMGVDRVWRIGSLKSLDAMPNVRGWKGGVGAKGDGKKNVG